MEKLLEYGAELMLIFSTLALAELKNYFQKKKSNKRKEQRQDLGYLMSKKNEIENYCVVVQNETKASHVGVWRFSNGQTYLDGDSIKRMSLYTEWAYPEELMIDEANVSMDLENVSKAIDELVTSESKFLQMDMGQAKDWHVNKMMRERGYKQMIWVLLKDQKKKPVGILEISFLMPIDYKLINSTRISQYKCDLEYKLEGKFD